MFSGRVFDLSELELLEDGRDVHGESPSEAFLSPYHPLTGFSSDRLHASTVPSATSTRPSGSSATPENAVATSVGAVAPTCPPE